MTAANSLPPRSLNEALNQSTLWLRSLSQNLRAKLGRTLRKTMNQPSDREIIEISDDEDQPMGRARTQSARPNDLMPARPISISSSSDDNAGDSQGPNLATRHSSRDKDSSHIDQHDMQVPVNSATVVAGPPTAQPGTRHGNCGLRQLLRIKRTQTSNGMQSLPVHTVPEPSSAATLVCPYYWDESLHLKMYRGPGHEKFPVVLGTVAGHKDICDQWDIQTAKMKEKQGKRLHLTFKSQKPGLQDMDSLTSAESPPFNPADPEDPHTYTKDVDRCVQDVLEVFPDIKPDFVQFLYNKERQRIAFSGASNTTDLTSISRGLIQQVAEIEAYPRQEDLKRKLAPDTEAEDGTGVTITWDKQAQKASEMVKDAVILLSKEFTHVPTYYIFKTVHEKQSLFEAYNTLAACENSYFQDAARPYNRMRQPRVVLEKKYTRRENEARDEQHYMSLVNELQAARQHQARESIRLKRQKAAQDTEAKNLAVHKAEGLLIDCQCCFDDQPMNRAVHCQGDILHFFCDECIKRQAQSQVGSMKHEMMCMDTSGCKAELSPDGVAAALSRQQCMQLLDKLAFHQQQAEISAAGIEGLEACPFCDYKAICDPVEVDSVFDCQNPDCGTSSCRKCKGISHLPKTCEEAKHDRGLGARHAVEEARSEAMMRTCPKCKVKIVKEYGCNKLVCSNCSTSICYVCKKDISGPGRQGGYEHFHAPGSTCPLHDQGVDRHRQDADAAEIAAIAKAKADDNAIDETALRIETGQSSQESLSTQFEYPRILPGDILHLMPRGNAGGFAMHPWGPEGARNLLAEMRNNGLDNQRELDLMYRRRRAFYGDIVDQAAQEVLPRMGEIHQEELERGPLFAAAVARLQNGFGVVPARAVRVVPAGAVPFDRAQYAQVVHQRLDGFPHQGQ